MEREQFAILEHLLTALAAGGLIGFERSFHGRPAGFRTHTLVCVASSALMLVTLYGGQWFPAAFSGNINLDPTRMAQGIMTGIGFLGAGVIFKEGLTVRGLTTAASIWVTAAIGILIGIGFHFAATVGAVATLSVLAAFRFLERRLPTEFYAHHSLTFEHDAVMGEPDLRRLLSEHGFTIANLSYRMSDTDKRFEYRMVIKTRDRRNAEALARR